MARKTPQHITRWAGQDYRTSKVHLHVLLTKDWELGYFYRTLLDALPEKGGSLPADPEELALDLGMPVETAARCIPILARFGKGKSRGGIVIHSDGTITNRRTTDDLKTARKRRQTLVESGRIGGLISAQARLKPPSGQVEPTPNLPKPLPLPSPTPLPLPSPTPTQNPEGAREVDPQALRLETAELEFDRLWSAYPEKGRKARHLAEREWASAIASGFTPPLAEILDAVAAQRRTEQWQRGVIPNLDRWIAERRWADAVDLTTGNGRRPVRDAGLGPDFSHQPQAPRTGPNSPAGMIAAQVLATARAGDAASCEEIELAKVGSADLGCRWPPTAKDVARLQGIAGVVEVGG